MKLCSMQYLMLLLSLAHSSPTFTMKLHFLAQMCTSKFPLVPLPTLVPMLAYKLILLPQQVHFIISSISYVVMLSLFNFQKGSSVSVIITVTITGAAQGAAFGSPVTYNIPLWDSSIQTNADLASFCIGAQDSNGNWDCVTGSLQVHSNKRSDKRSVSSVDASTPRTGQFAVISMIFLSSLRYLN